MKEITEEEKKRNTLWHIERCKLMCYCSLSNKCKYCIARRVMEDLLKMFSTLR